MAATLTSRSGWCCLFLAAAAGCGGGGPVPVRGTVKLDDKPLAGATVLFIAQDAGGRDAAGTTDADGVFRLTTFRDGDGALPGKYKVVVQLPAATRGGEAAGTQTQAQQGSTAPQAAQGSPPSVLPRFSQPDQTPLEQVVPPSGEIVYDLKSK
jgi:hypothetical protein